MPQSPPELEKELFKFKARAEHAEAAYEKLFRDNEKLQEEIKRLKNGSDPTPLSVDPEPLKLANWLARDIPGPDRLLGWFLTTTTRLLLVATTGLGKTNVMLAVAFAIAAGNEFLHWSAGEGPRKVLYIDGEMSLGLMQRRLIDAERRLDECPDTLLILSFADFPERPPPLNSEAGQRFIDKHIDALGGVDAVIFDNIQALLVGDMREEGPWEPVLPWIRDLTRREIGQVWVHHTGHDETRSYGIKAREWQMDAVALLERADRPEADIAFTLKFTKARDRTPENRADFEPVTITLANDQWSFEIAPAGSGKASPKMSAKMRALEALRDVIAKDGQVPPSNRHIPTNTACVSEELWREYGHLRRYTWRISHGFQTNRHRSPRREGDREMGPLGLDREGRP